MPQEHHRGVTCDTSPNLEKGPTSWPADTNLLRLHGSSQLALSAQVQLVRFVIQDAIDLLCASLLFRDAFPKSAIASALIQDALLVSAEKYKPASFHIHQHLMHDSKYMLEMAILVSLRVSKITLLTFFSVFSRVLGSPLSDVMSKNAASLLSRQPS